MSVKSGKFVRALGGLHACCAQWQMQKYSSRPYSRSLLPLRTPFIYAPAPLMLHPSLRAFSYSHQRFMSKIDFTGVDATSCNSQRHVRTASAPAVEPCCSLCVVCHGGVGACCSCNASTVFGVQRLLVVTAAAVGAPVDGDVDVVGFSSE